MKNSILVVAVLTFILFIIFKVFFGKVKKPSYSTEEERAMVVELFCEENLENRQLTRTNFVDWQNNKDMKALSDVRRNIHAMLGSSSLAGLTVIHETTSELIKVLNGLLSREINDIETANSFIEQGLMITEEQVNSVVSEELVELPKDYLSKLKVFLATEGL